MVRKLLFTAALVASGAAFASPPAKFINDSIQGDNSEMRLGALIAQRGSSPAVRSFGNTLVRDHTKARASAAMVAHQMSAPVPTSMMPEARAEYAKLQHLRGAAFDAEAKRYMIHDHQKDISDNEEQAKSGDKRTAALAQSSLPTLRKHLQLAQALPH